MNKKNKKLTPKQQKALDRQIRSQNARKPVAMAPKRPPMPTDKKWLLALIALAVVLAVVTATLGAVALHRTLSMPKHASLLDTVDLSNYLTVDRSNYTGQTATVSYDDVYTDEDFEADKKAILFNNRKLLAATQEDFTLGVGDTVYFYILGASQAGEKVAAGAFADYSYANFLSVTIGADHGYGEGLDAALTGLSPKDTVRNTSTSVALEEDSIISLTYEMYVASKYNETTGYTWKTTAYKTASAARTDMQALSDAFRAGLMDAVAKGAIGEKVSFILEDYDHDGKSTTANVAVRIDACVNFVVVDEVTTTITFTPAKDCFAGQGYAALCKDMYEKETTFEVILQWADDYELPSFNAAFIKETLGCETEETTDEAVVAAYRAMLAENLAEQVAENKISAIYGQILNAIQNNFKDIPQELYYDEYYKASTELQLQYSLYGAATYGDIDSFTAAYSYYQLGQQITSADTYCSMMAEMQSMKELLTYTIFYAEGMKVTDEALAEARKQCLADMVDKAGNPEVYDEEYFITLYGDETVWQMARREYAIPALVEAFLLANNTVKLPSAES